MFGFLLGFSGGLRAYREGPDRYFGLAALLLLGLEAGGMVLFAALRLTAGASAA